MLLEIVLGILLGASCYFRDQKSNRRYIYHIPYEITMTYLGIWHGNIEEYKDDHGGASPPWYYTPLFMADAAYFMVKGAKALISKRLSKQIDTPSPFKQVVTQLDKDTARISYEWKGSVYHIIKQVKHHHICEFVSAHGKRNVGLVTGVLNEVDEKVVEEEEDVTEEIKQYLGPHEDWHDVHLTAGRIGYTTLKISKLDSETFDVVERTFGEHDQLIAIKDL